MRSFFEEFAGRPGCLSTPVTRAVGLLICFSITPELLAGQGAGSAKDALNLHEHIAWQIALERTGFSPGIIDGKIGTKTGLATREFQRVRGLPQTGTLDATTARALDVGSVTPVTTYTISEADAHEVIPTPAEWIKKSRQKRLGYDSVAQVVAEKFHASQHLLARLNPGRNLLQLNTGDSLDVPATGDTTSLTQADMLEVDLNQKIIRALDGEKRLVALFHCSIAADKAKLPTGSARVVTIAKDPVYHFDPKMWPEVKGVDRKLEIPPGPRNPVGVRWIGLSLPGYGIHGTPNPELIGKTGSHGCVRLTNWDAVRLASMVRVGTPVRFTRGTPPDQIKDRARD